LRERRDTRHRFRIVHGKWLKHTDPPHLVDLLRARRERPRGGRATNNCDEFPPPHGAYPKAKDHGTKHSRCWGGSVARIAPKRSAGPAPGRALETPTGATYLWRIFKA